MANIEAEMQSVRDLLKDEKYKIEYYQREYKWGERQVADLITDLAFKFKEKYNEGDGGDVVGDYPSYFLGSIIIKKTENGEDGYSEIVDGQQRLTSLTLLIIFLNNLKKKSENKILFENQQSLGELISSTKLMKRSFNIAIEERALCMQALYDEKSNEVPSVSKFVEKYAREAEAKTSVENLYKCYQNINANFPPDLRNGEALFCFIEWLLERVNLVRITTPSNKDAYTIFKTMNDRGLPLSPTDMLKSFLLSKLSVKDRESVNSLWKGRLRDLNILQEQFDFLKGKGDEDFFKAWFRSQYATKIRPGSKGAKNENFDLIGTEFHRWADRPGNGIGFESTNGYLKFSTTDFKFYSEQYMRLLKASKIESLGTPEAAGLEHVCYNAQHKFTLQYMVLLAPLRPEDTPEEITKKIQITARYIDILLTWRLWNSQSIGYSGMQYAMFLVMNKIRACPSASELGGLLFDDLQKIQKEDAFFGPRYDPSYSERLCLNGHNGPKLRIILARITDFVTMQSVKPSEFRRLMEGERGSRGKKDPYELEHILSNKHDHHKEEFPHAADFARYRNQFGGLLLLPKSFNAAFGSKSYKEKLEQYFGQNFLAKTLHPNCYVSHPDFKRFLDSTGLPFKPVEAFNKKEDIDERGDLYRAIAKLVWNPDDLLEVAKEPKS